MNDRGWKSLVIGIQTTVIVLFLGFYFSSAQEFVTKADLKVMAPYVPDRTLIFQHMERTTQALNKLNESLDKQNEKFDLEITALKVQMAGMKGNRP